MINTPTISIIIVTWNNENFIEQAVQSCFFPPRAEPVEHPDDHAAAPLPPLPTVEIIVVHNASTDRTGDLLQRMLTAHPGKFRVVENATNVGLGEARNIGVTHARGEYILFLDGDDWFDPNALSILGDLLEETTPDVTVFNHARVYDTGFVRKNIQSKKLAKRDASDNTSRIALLENFNVAWNKLYRTSFIRKYNLRFAQGLYEDIDWHFLVLTLAASVYAIPTVMIYYRQRSGSILRSQSEAHRDVMTRYRDIMTFFANRPDLAAVFEKTAYKHGRLLMFNILLNEDRLPQNTKAQYLKDITALLTEWRLRLKYSPQDRVMRLGASVGPTGLKAVFQTYRGIKRSATYKKLVDLKKVAGAKYRKTKGKLTAWARVKAYNTFCRLPLQENTVLFESFWGKKADCNPLAISNYLQDQGGYDITWSLHKSFDAKGFPQKSVTMGSFAYLRALATSKYLVNNANFPTEYKKRAGSIHVQTKHGTPLKSMGLDIRTFRPKEMNWDNFAERCRRWDYVISSNPYSSRVWRQGFPYNYKILETGYPRNDVMFTVTPDETAAIRKSLDVPAGKKIALYAPTFRNSAANNAALFSEGLFDAQNVAAALGPDYVLLVRSHYFTAIKGDMPGAIDASDYPSTNPLLAVTDLLITDYSSIMFDYACLRRPIVIFAHDIPAYNAARGTYFSILEKNPGPVTTTREELLMCLQTKAFDLPENRQKLQAFADEFSPWDDGAAAARVVQAVFGASAARPA